MTETDTRLELSRERIREIPSEAVNAVFGEYSPYFIYEAQSIQGYLDEYDFLHSEAAEGANLAVWKIHNLALYEDILPENYARSWCNPAYAAKKLGEEYGPILSAIAAELRSIIPLVYEDRMDLVLPRIELFLELYTAFAVAKRQAGENTKESGAEPCIPPYRAVQKILSDYVTDLAEDEADYDIASKLTDESRLADEIITESDLTDLRYLYRFGEYISESEIRTAEHMNRLSEEDIARMADTYTEGYRIGFEVTGKDLSSKTYVGIIYHLGFERMIRRAVSNFEALGKTCVFYREIETLSRLRGSGRAGYGGAEPNPQFRYDHREDLALVLDDEMNTRRIEALESAYKSHDAKTRLFAGPAVIETFGEEPFTPLRTAAQPGFDKAQTRLVTRYRQKASFLYNEHVVGRNRSFTVISFPMPEIAKTQEEYEKIFDAVIDINTLDYQKYQRIQQILINTLDRADRLHIVGAGNNRTDLTVNLWKLTDPSRQTIFENCVADVNIPVGEVFTSPVLEGTNGSLHVSGVYLEGLLFRDLELTFKDGRIQNYSCANFEGEEDAEKKGREYIEENILFHHETLPMGECAIGTNTTAYAVGRKYGISGKLPILIAEKTGPHFAVGDTCYSNEEDNVVYNPDGKEIVAKENDYSLRRDKDPEHAYFGCHTDITIPYEELGVIETIEKDGQRSDIIRNGRFVLPGTEELNAPLDELQE